MISLGYGKKPSIKNSQFVNSFVLVRIFLLDLYKHNPDYKFDLTKESGIKDLIDKAQKITTINLQSNNGFQKESSEENHIKLTYIKSNLGRGFIVLFECLSCGRKVKNLYFPPNSLICACRNCHRISYL